MKALLKLYWAATWGYPNINKFKVFMWHVVLLTILLLIFGIFAGIGNFVWVKLFSLFS